MRKLCTQRRHLQRDMHLHPAVRYLTACNYTEGPRDSISCPTLTTYATR